MSHNLSENSEFKIIQEHLDLQSGNVLVFSNNSEISNFLSSEKLQIFSSLNQTISDKIDNLLSTDTFQAEFSKNIQKFDTIIIHNIFEEIKHPGFFLKNLDSILSDDGTIICSISNFHHINNIINLFVGQHPNYLFDKTLTSYDLDTILFLLNENNMHITEIFRIKEEFLPEKTDLDNTLVPSKLVEIIQKISDYDTYQYILMIGKGKTISSENLKFLSQFPKNYLLPPLQEFFEKFIEFENAIVKKDKVIQGLENSIKDITGHSGNSLAKKDKVIQGHENSIKEQTKIIQGHENSIKEQTKIIQGHENSIKEQQEFIKNLEEHIRQLESNMTKLKFWKK